ncbi:SIMPL domain-containing protein [Mucilaginibacter sp. ZT4R22]|uniref:SIMPL domain-containing protein n=1 Tax=Mucilaginibacter pankratovii TaxID=2772110 RepID=A0ABR7WTT8_9SPHI|nr:SIMPL domain-containing protein [Mucilaginibacter pankratovii]MBD1365723.1 SIMPL domain-containing protein [Mucilaginibacter pankratovii]
MKKILIVAALVTFALNVFAQTTDLRRKIEVSGIAEQEVIPDIIKVTISLKEYFTKDKKKVTISQLETQLQKALADAGVSKEDLSIDDLSASNWEERKKHLNFLASKQYIVKFKELTKYNQILGKLDAKGVESTQITDYDYSKITAVKKELKIKALLAARDKAEYLLNSVGEKLGGVLNISEVDEPASRYDNVAQYSNSISFNNSGASDSNINFKTIKLRFQVSAVFEIK